VNLQDPANHVPIDLNTESQRDLLGNAGTAPLGIPPFHLHHGWDECIGRSLGARSTTVPRGEQPAIFSFSQPLVEMQQSGRFQNDSRTKNACRADEKGAQGGDDPIRRAQIGCPLAPAIQDQKLMSDQHAFGNNRTEPARFGQLDQDDGRSNE
jgi:hypothetical protein